MEKKEILCSMKERGAMLEGHFRLTSGLHSSTYLQMAILLEDPSLGFKLGALLGEKFQKEKVDVVVGPALGGIIIAYMVGMALQCRAIFSERDQDGFMTLRRGFALPRKSQVLIVEDVITTGGSVMEAMKLVKEMEGEVIGIGTICDRSNEEISFPLKSLIRLPLETYLEKDCPLCRKGIPLTAPGSRKR